MNKNFMWTKHVYRSNLTNSVLHPERSDSVEKVWFFTDRREKLTFLQTDDFL